MSKISQCGKNLLILIAGMDISTGDHVIVETARSEREYGLWCWEAEVEDFKVVSPLKPVIRMATPDDVEAIEANNKKKEKDAFKICKEKDRQARSADEVNRRGIHL